MWLNRKKRKRNERLAFSVKRLVGKFGLTANRYTLSAKSGFTLIEVMVAASILGIIGLTILTTFASGFQVYDRVQSYGGVQADALIALDTLERELHNTFPLSTVPVEGSAGELAFPAIIETLENIDGEERIVSSLGRIYYFFDEANAALIRAEQDYGQASSGQKPSGGSGEPLVTIDSFAFSYLTFNQEAKDYSWGTSWKAQEADPLVGVKVELGYQNGGEPVILTRTVFLNTSFEEDEEAEGGGEDEGEGEE